MLTYLTRGRLSPSNDAVFLVTQGRLAGVGYVPPIPPPGPFPYYEWTPDIKEEVLRGIFAESLFSEKIYKTVYINLEKDFIIEL